MNSLYGNVALDQKRKMLRCKQELLNKLLRAQSHRATDLEDWLRVCNV